MKTQDYISLEERYGAHNYRPLDVVVHKAKGAWTTDVTERNIPIASRHILPSTRGIVTPLLTRRSSTRRRKSR